MTSKVWACVVDRMPQEELFKRYAGHNGVALLLTIFIGIVAFGTISFIMWAIAKVPAPVFAAGTITYVVLTYVFRTWEPGVVNILKSTLIFTAYFIVMLMTGELIGFALIIFGILVTVSLLITHNTLAILMMWKDLNTWAREQKAATTGNDDSTPAIEPAAGVPP